MRSCKFEMKLERVPQAKIYTTPIKGPFSEYLGWREVELLIALVRSVEPKVMIEIGVNTGLTAKRVLDNVPSLEKYIGIDVPPDHKPAMSCQYSEVPVNPGCYAADDPRFYLLIAGTPLTVDDLEPCDAVFIDGDHSAAAVAHDSNLARALVRPRGVIVWHDAGNESVEVTQTLEALNSESWSIKQIDGSWLAYCRC